MEHPVVVLPSLETSAEISARRSPATIRAGYDVSERENPTTAEAPPVPPVEAELAPMYYI